MSDAQVDGGDTGQRGEDLANNVVGDRDPAQVVFWYGGVYSGIWVLISIYGYMLLNNDIFWVVMNSSWWVYHIGTYMPLFMAWLMLSFFDGPFMRNVFTGLVEITFLGPYFAHWKAITDFILLGEVMDNDWTDDNWKSFDEVGFYVWIAIYGAVTIFEMIIQITVAPRIFEWLESAETLDNDEPKEDERLFALMF